jgi:hypothetical protein
MVIVLVLARAAEATAFTRDYRAPGKGRYRVVVVGPAPRFCALDMCGSRSMAGDRNAGYEWF